MADLVLRAPGPADIPALSLLGWCKLALACPFPAHARGTRTMELKQLYTAPNAQGSGASARR